MVSKFNNDTLAGMIKANPDLENIIQTVIAANKNTTSMFVHELRNPLALLKGTVQYIELKHPEVKEFKYWDQVQDLINDMENIMQDASMLNNSMLLNRETTDLITLLNSILSNFMPQALTQQIDLAMNIAPGCEKYFTSYSCDGGKLKQVFTNMIKNAFEATKPGNFIHISLSAYPEDNPNPRKLSISLSNNGLPIPEAALESIFQPFVSYKKGGTGVGLALVQRIINLHYGSISVTSDESLTTFTILLPL